MKSVLFSFLISIGLVAGLQAQNPTVTSISFDNVSHGSARVWFGWTGSNPNYARIRYIASPGTCTGGTGGTVEIHVSNGFSGFGLNVWDNTQTSTMELGGLTPGTTYQICPELSLDNSTWSTASGATMTTLAAPAVDPAYPNPPSTFDTSYPDTSTGYTTISVASDCSDLQSDINTAIAGQSQTQGYILSIAPGTTCSGSFHFPSQDRAQSADVLNFTSSNVATGASSSITITNHGFTEGQPIVFGGYYGTFPASTSCPDALNGGNRHGIVSGFIYYAHYVNNNTFQVYCGAPAGSPGAVQMVFTDQGSVSGIANLQVAPAISSMKWIIIRTSTPDAQFTPQGVRTGPQWASKMPVVMLPASSVPSDQIALYGHPTSPILMNVAGTDNGAANIIHQIRFVGLEFTGPDYAGAHNSIDPSHWHGLINVPTQDQTIIFDRCYVHGPTLPQRIHRAMFWDGAYTAVIDSYFDNLTYWHTAYSGLPVAQASSNSFTVGAGTHQTNGNPVTLSGTGTVHITGTGTGTVFVGFDLTNSNAFTVAFPATGGLSLSSCSGVTCGSLTQPSINVFGASSTSGFWGSCDYYEPVPQNPGGEASFALVGCIHFTGGTIDRVQQSPRQPAAVWNTEGTNFMVGGLGPGPYIFRNNYTDGAGLLFHWDDCDGRDTIGQSANPTISCRDVHKSDYTVTRNTFKFPLTYMYGNPNGNGLKYWVRQPIEWKAGERAKIDGNIFDGAWTEDNPASAAITLTATGKGQGIRDFEISNNEFKHVPGVLGMSVTQSPGVSTYPMIRMWVHNNLAWDINNGSPATCNDTAGSPHDPSYWSGFGQTCGNGWFIQSNFHEDIRVEHNVVLGYGRASDVIRWSSNTRTEGVSITDNIFNMHINNGMAQEPSGITGFSDSCGGLSAKAIMDCEAVPFYKFSRNLLMSDTYTQGQLQSAYPSPLVNYIPSDPSNLSSLGWFNYTGPTGTKNDFHLKSNYCSGCGNPGTDGKDVGVDVDALRAAQGMVTLVGVPANTITTTQGTVAFVAPDSVGCSVDYSSSDPTLISSFTRVSDAGGSRVRNINLTSLTTKTTYYYRVNCQTQQPTGLFVTK